MTDIQFSPQSYAEGARGMAAAGQELESRTGALLSQVSELSVLGTNDTLGGVSQMIYGAFLGVFQDTVAGGAEALGWQSDNLAWASEQYRGLEESIVDTLERFRGDI